MIFLIYYTKSTGLWIGRFSSTTFLGFTFLMLLFPFLASLLLIAAGAGWNWITRRILREESRAEVELIPLLFFRELLCKEIDFFLLCLRSSELFSEKSTLSYALFAILFQHKCEKKKTVKKILSNSRAPSSSRVNNGRERTGIGTRL